MKNEKQLQQEWDAIYQQKYKEIKILVVQIDDIGTGNPRLVDRSVDAFARSLYLTAPEDLSEEEVKRR